MRSKVGWGIVTLTQQKIAPKTKYGILQYTLSEMTKKELPIQKYFIFLWLSKPPKCIDCKREIDGI